MNMEIEHCPFCKGKAKLSFKEVEFAGRNYLGDKKSKYRVQVICNRCKSRGKLIKTDWLINCDPRKSRWVNGYDWIKIYITTLQISEQTEMLRPYVEKAIEAWNRREE